MALSPSAATRRFRELHREGCFAIPNPWDVGSARFLEHLGFKALASTSAGLAFSRGLPDDVTALPRDVVLAHVRELAAATSLPLNADFQNGYADAPEGVARNVALAVETGIAGLSIEDATGAPGSPLYERALAVERIRAAKTAIDASGTEVLLTARCEAWLLKVEDARRVALDRLVAFADAGADCLFAPGVRDPAAIAELVRAVAPKPLNVLVSMPGLTMASLEQLGVRRVSVGSALARAAWAGFAAAAREIASSGTFDSLGRAMTFAELNDLFG